MAEEIKEKKPIKETEEEIKYLVRIANTDIEGKKQLLYGLTKIKGVSNMLSNCVCSLAKIDTTKKIGILNNKEIEKINQILESPVESGVPLWMLNRRRDPETNEPIHLNGPNLKFVQGNDIKQMRKIKSYKGVRHSRGLPVRGQRTKSNFRKSKTKGKGTLGVKKAKGR